MRAAAATAQESITGAHLQLPVGFTQLNLYLRPHAIKGG